jgi:hypothetical protein
MKGRRREVDHLVADLTSWAQSRSDVQALALVGSYARGAPRIASDVDLVVIAEAYERLAADPAWFGRLRPASTLIRARAWGPLLERRYRLRSGLHVELGFVSPTWIELPLDPGTRRVLGDGHRALHDPRGLIARAGVRLYRRVPHGDLL